MPSVPRASQRGAFEGVLAACLAAKALRAASRPICSAWALADGVAICGLPAIGGGASGRVAVSARSASTASRWVARSGKGGWAAFVGSGAELRLILTRVFRAFLAYRDQVLGREHRDDAR